jgi:hypothetical protein
MNALNVVRNRNHNPFARVFAFAAIAALFLLLPARAHADSNTTYDFSGTLSNGSSFSGVLDFDTNASGVTTLVNSNFTVGGVSFSCNGASSNTCIVENAGSSDYFQALSGGSLVVLSWAPFNFLNPPANFSFNGGYCMNCSGGGIFIVTGGGATAAPEPATWLLLAFGLFAVAILFKRKSASTIA